MARISMRNVQKSTVSQYFDLYLSAAAARGVKDKTLHTYKQHFQSIAKRLDVTVPMNRLNSADLDKMILTMREEGLSASSINSYTRTLKVFFSWCNEEGHTKLNIKLYKAPETVKEVYTDEELLILLKKPEAKDALEHAEMLYLMTLEMSNRYHAYLNNNLSDEVFEKIKHRMFVLGKLHGRACQVYCEVLWLLRGGFSDGAYARWRSLYELSVIAEFIKANDEAIAMKFTDSAYFDEKDYEWAKSAPCFAHLTKKSRISFEMIRKQCEIIAESWKNAYKDSCQVVHATPLGTLGRIGSRDETKSTLVGPSDYGLEIPGVNATISLMHVTMFYFGMANHADSKVFILTMQKWLDELIDCYRNIATNAFLQGSPAE